MSELPLHANTAYPVEGGAGVVVHIGLSHQ